MVSIPRFLLFAASPKIEVCVVVDGGTPKGLLLVGLPPNALDWNALKACPLDAALSGIFEGVGSVIFDDEPNTNGFDC